MIVDLILVVVGGALGAALRYNASSWFKARSHSDFRWGTFTVNVAAAFFTGIAVQAGMDGGAGPRVQLLVVTGFCGALSTWSTFSYELLTLASARRLAVAAGYLTLTLVIGLGLSFAGAVLARAFG